MEYSISLFIEALINYSGWFVLYPIVYGVLGLFVFLSFLFIVSAFGGFANEKVILIIVASGLILLIGYPRPELFTFVAVKGKYVEPIKAKIHEEQLENLNSKEISKLLNFDPKFYDNFTKYLLLHTPKNVEISIDDLNDELYSDYKACFMNKFKPYEPKMMKIKEIYSEVESDKVSCAIYSARLLENPKRIKQFINKI